MLFAVSYSNQPDGNEDRDARTLKLLSAWKPPAGFEFKGWYDYADGSGGVAIVESQTAEVLLEAIAPWALFLSFSVKPVVPIEKSTPIFERMSAWRSSIR
jgi:hypothetical protein